MTSLENFLLNSEQDTSVQKIIRACAQASIEISVSIRLKDTEKKSTQNASGDKQSKLDVTSDIIFIERLTKTKLVKTIASEEQEELIEIPNAGEEHYFVAYDPYDGGGVGDANMTFGSIIGLWSRNPLGSAVGEHLLVGCYALYGPQLTFVISLGGSPTIFEYDEKAEEFFLLQKGVQLSPSTTHCSPGNFRNIKHDNKYQEVLRHWITGDYKLLYAGALVTDINHILMKGHGIFVYPRDEKYPDGKLRLLYEGGPLGILIERAGGKAVTQEGKRLLDQVIHQTHQRETFFLGSTQEVELVTKMMK